MNHNPIIIVLPDIHGRKFWTDVMDYDCEIVFLGDYLDPYSHEGITKVDALDNFEHILEFAKTNPKVHLLYGNHDCEYSIGKEVCNCRCDHANYDYIRNLFVTNENLFNFVHIAEVAGKKFVFSHAGFHPRWVGRNGFDPESVMGVRNDAKTWRKFVSALCDVSRMRGGWSPSGSLIWADIREFEATPIDFDYEQVVGHTYLMGKPIGNDKITCIDIQRPFMVCEDGVLREMDGSDIDKIII